MLRIPAATEPGSVAANRFCTCPLLEKKQPSGLLPDGCSVMPVRSAERLTG